jgi:hypothetical protein
MKKVFLSSQRTIQGKLYCVFHLLISGKKWNACPDIVRTK